MERKKMNAAKQFMLSWMAPRKEYKPSDFDEIVGDCGFNMSGTPVWNRTPFFDALSLLVKQKKVHYWRSANGAHHYMLNTGQKCPKSTFVITKGKNKKLTPEELRKAKIAHEMFLNEMDELFAKIKTYSISK